MRFLQASKGNVGLLRLLLKAGAKPNRKDATGSTPLHRAASAGKAEAVRVRRFRDPLERARWTP